MVAEQRETVQRIDADTVDIASNVSGAQRELLKYYASISSNRWLMLKVFGVLIVFVSYLSSIRAWYSLSDEAAVPHFHPGFIMGWGWPAYVYAQIIGLWTSRIDIHLGYAPSRTRKTYRKSCTINRQVWHSHRYLKL